MMSFFIKAGYDGCRKQIVNIGLLKNDFWKEGIVTVYNNNNVKLNFRNSMKLTSEVNNTIELIKYNHNYALMINNMIVYDSPKLFTYDVNLFFPIKNNNYATENILNYVKYDMIELSNVVNFNNLRTLN